MTSIGGTSTITTTSSTTTITKVISLFCGDRMTGTENGVVQTNGGAKLSKSQKKRCGHIYISPDLCTHG